MRTTRLLLAVALLWALALPAAALDLPTGTGERIDLIDPPAIYPADTPFHVVHGNYWIEPVSMREVRSRDTRFELFVDGRRVPARTIVEFDPADGVYAAKWHLSNFQRGLGPGTYNFTGVWHQGGEEVLRFERTIVFTSSERLNIILLSSHPDPSFPARTPFHIRHSFGWPAEPGGEVPDNVDDYAIEIYMDGVLLETTTIVDTEGVVIPEFALTKSEWIEFPRGLRPGVYTFTLVFIDPDGPYISFEAVVRFE